MIDNRRGIGYMVLAGLSFMVVNFFVKLLGPNNDVQWFGELQVYPAHELVLARSVVSFAISYYIIKKRKLPVLGVNRKWLLIRGVTGMIALTIFFYTIHHLPIAIASTIQYLAPIFTVVFAIFILNQKILRMQWFFIVTAFLGVGLIGAERLLSDTAKLSWNPLWLALGILSAAFSGLAYNAITKLKGTDEPINIVLYFPMLSIPIMTAWSFFEFTLPVGIEWLILLVIGIFTQIAQICMTKAFHFGETATIAPFQYLGAVYAILVGYLFFNEFLSASAILGISIILLSVVLNSQARRLFKRRHT